MCVLAFAWRAHPQWPLVLIGNRDELHARPAAPLARWTDASHVLGGIDLSAGGAWLGVSEQGRLAVVTNVRGYGPPEFDRPSRGQLVAEVLTGQGPYAEPAIDTITAFNPMNLITARAGQAQFWSNRPKPQNIILTPGIVGMANGGLEDGWPKTDRLKAFLAAWLAEGSGSPVPLLAALADEHRPPDNLLPATGLPLERERAASAIFIRSALYGTRCSTVVMIAKDGQGLIAERRFGEDGEETGETQLSFNWPISAAPGHGKASRLR